MKNVKVYKETRSNLLFRQLNVPEVKMVETESADIEKGKDCRSGISKPDNPMEINTVIDCLFNFLNLDDVKNCRLMNRKWNFVAENKLRKRAMISFGISKDSGKLLSPMNYKETFSASTANITSFRFKGNVNWNISVVRDFFEVHAKKIRELRFECLKLKEKKANYLENYEITNWFSNLPLTKLDITCCSSTILGFSLNDLLLIKDIKLHQCHINVEDGVRIAPINIVFNYVKFYKDGNELADYYINNSIDFQNTKSIIICCTDSSSMKLDLSDSFNVEKINLQNVQAVNWKKSKSSVKNLYLLDTPFLENSGMQIKTLDFDGTEIDLCGLPKGIEKIRLGVYEPAHILCSGPIHLPCLKYLDIFCSTAVDLLPLSYFSNCPNMADVNLSQTPKKLNVSCIPESVKRMKIKNDEDDYCEELEIYGEDLRLEKLVLDGFDLFESAKIVKKITPDVLVLRWYKKRHPEILGSVLVFLMQFQIKTLYVGPFTTTSNFEGSHLNDYVDNQAEYYVFERNPDVSDKDLRNLKGKAFDSKEFHNMCKFEHELF